MQRKLWLDFETRSLINIKDTGTDRYVRDSSTEVLMLAWAIDNGEVNIWLPILGEPMPAELHAAMIDPTFQKFAWNYRFERGIFEHQLGYVTQRGEWFDPSVLAGYMALPIGLDRASKAMHLNEEEKKIKTLGDDRLTKIFSQQSKRKKNELKKNPDLAPMYYRDWNTDPEKWQEFIDYCFTPDHKLLGEDLIWKPAADFKTGDRVLGFDELGTNRYFKAAEIESIRYEDAPTFKVTLASGHIFRVTGEHRWLTGLKHQRWTETKDLLGSTHPRTVHRYMIPWTSEKSYNSGWLAGLYDGEGSYSARTLTLGQNTGRVANNFVKEMESRNFVIGKSGRKKCKTFWVKGGKYESLRALGTLRPKRLLNKVNFDQLGRMERRGLNDQIVSVEPIGNQTIVKIQTSCSTMIVDGYPMHNCKNDVRAERAVWDAEVALGCPMPESEIKVWLLDQRMNDTGVFIDLPYVHGAAKYATAEVNGIMEEMKSLTGLENPNSTTHQLKPWLQQRGYPFDSCAKEYIDEAITNAGHFKLTPLALQVLKLKQKLGGSAYTKLEKILDMVSQDGWLRNQFLYHGAHTGRWSGRGVQLQNLFKPDPRVSDVLDEVTQAIKNGTLDIPAIVAKENEKRAAWNAANADKPPKKPLDSFNIMDAVAGTIRSAFCAPPGYKLVMCDLAQIESRVLAALAGCQTMIDAYKNGEDLYISFMSWLLKKPLTKKDKAERQRGKVVILGCGFGMGVDKFIEYAATFGVELSEKEAKEAVYGFREKYKEIPAFWKALDTAVKKAIKGGVCVYVNGGIVVDGRNEMMLKIKLPSGRYLHYYKPSIEVEMTDYGPRDSVCYESWDAKGKQKKRLYGGLICENVVQAVARDILVNGMFLAEKVGFVISMTIHDELVCLCKIDSGLGIKDLEKAMITVPWWGEDLGFFLGAEGDENGYYKK
jgi:DNA polymerase